MRTLAIFGCTTLLSLTSCSLDTAPKTDCKLGVCDAGSRAGHAGHAATDGSHKDAAAVQPGFDASTDAGSAARDAGMREDSGSLLDARVANDSGSAPDSGQTLADAGGGNADAGLDSGTPDASVDSGTPDAGHDSGPPPHLAVCGDGTVDNGEECDDHNNDGDDGCSASCVLECGDSTREAHEQCEGNDLNGKDCAARGFAGGVLACKSDCTYETSGCLAVPTCNNGTIEVGEDCEDGNLVNGDGCSALCRSEPTEIEPNEDGSPSVGFGTIAGNDFNATAVSNANANGVFDAKDGAVNIRAALTPAGDEDVFAFTNGQSSAIDLQLDTWNRAQAYGYGVSCADSIDTGINVRNAAGSVLASNDDRDTDNDRCSSVRISLLPGQTVYAHVVAFGDNSVVPSYLLSAQFLPIVCGDATRSATEECEDHNTNNGDGCSSSCHYEGVVGEVEPNANVTNAGASTLQIAGNTLIHGAIGSAGDQDVYRVTITTPTVVRFETFTSLVPGDCSAGTLLDLRLLDASGTLILSDTEGLGIAGCGAIVYYLSAGTYFVRVEESGNNASVADYFLEAAYQTDRGAEAEGQNASGNNDTRAAAAANLSASAATEEYVFGSHLMGDDSDFYSIKVPAGYGVRAELIEGDRSSESCESNGVDSRLTLYGSNGLQRSDDDDSGRGFCSLIDGTGSAPVNTNARNTGTSMDTFYLQVRRAAAAVSGARQFVYRLQVTFRK